MKLLEKDDVNKMEADFVSRLKTNPRLLFGGFPTKSGLEQLQREGVKYIIDLTTLNEKEKLNVYDAKEYQMIYVNFPIKDNFIPYDIKSFNDFIIWLMFTMNVLKEKESMYIHCKGGHGRSGMVVCCLLCLLHDLTPEQSIGEVTESHRDRPNLGLKWKTRLCPSNNVQRIFVNRICSSSEILKSSFIV